MLTHGFRFVDLTEDDSAKEHVRHMIGGFSPEAKDEVFYNINFPERPRALQDFLNAIGSSYNISLFHYRGLGGDTGRVMMGFECDNPNNLESIFKSINYEAEKVHSKTVELFLSR